MAKEVKEAKVAKGYQVLKCKFVEEVKKPSGKTYNKVIMEGDEIETYLPKEVSKVSEKGEVTVKTSYLNGK
jgi:hypothetical protein